MIKKILLPLMMLFALNANAGLWIEPYAGYSINAIDLKESVGGFDLKYAFKDVRMGGRVGFKNWGLMMGVDYNMGSGSLTPDIDATVDDDLAALLPEGDVNITNLGVYAGYKLPLFLKVWGTYWLSSKYTYANDNALSGSGYSVGVGFAPIPLPLPLIDLFINVEYKMLTMDEFDSSAVDYDVKEILLSVSVPISL